MPEVAAALGAVLGETGAAAAEALGARPVVVLFRVMPGRAAVQAAVRLLAHPDMAEPTPWQMTRRTQPTVRKQEVFKRDLYNFTATSISQGTNQPVVNIPSMGPAAAGAVPPTKYPEVETVVVTITGSIGPDYGVNSHQPS